MFAYKTIIKQIKLSIQYIKLLELKQAVPSAKLA